MFDCEVVAVELELDPLRSRRNAGCLAYEAPRRVGRVACGIDNSGPRSFEDDFVTGRLCILTVWIASRYCAALGDVSHPRKWGVGGARLMPWRGNSVAEF